MTAGAPPPVQQSGFHPADVNVGPVLRVSQAPYVFEPSIAVNPHQSEQLAATVVTASDSECEEPDCQLNLLLYNSSDGGATWSEQMPFGSPRQDVWDGMSRFGPDGTLYALGLRNRIAVNRSAADSPAGPYQMVPADTVNVMSSWVFNPWLDVNADDGELFLTYAGRYRDNLGINLKRSTSQGDEWTFAVPVDKGVPLSDLEKGQATPPLAPKPCWEDRTIWPFPGRGVQAFGGHLPACGSQPQSTAVRVFLHRGKSRRRGAWQAAQRTTAPTISFSDTVLNTSNRSYWRVQMMAGLLGAPGR